MRRRLAIAIGLALMAGPALAQEAVFLIRHAEKAAGDNPPITEAGRLRAARWAEMLAGTGIEQVYTSTARRTMETGAIIAEALGVETEAVETGDTAGLLDMVSFDFEEGRVLVVGHTETIPGILNALGSIETVEMPLDDFSRLFVVVPGGDAPVVLDMAMP